MKEDFEVSSWAKSFGVSPESLRLIVGIAGPYVQDVKKFIIASRERKTPTPNRLNPKGIWADMAFWAAMAILTSGGPLYYVYLKNKGEILSPTMVTGWIIVIGLVGGTKLFFEYLADNRRTPGDSYSGTPLGQEIEHLKIQIETLKLRSMGGEGNTALVESLKKTVLSATAQEIIEEVKNDLAKNETEQRLNSFVGAIPTRLTREIEALRKRSNINLFIGIVLGVSGLVILALVAFKEVSPVVNERAFFISSVPRIALALLVEFLAYFFLRLYKEAAHEIRFFHNELTNHEARAAALCTARLGVEDEPTKLAIAAFLQTERNFILQKDQSTVSIETKKLDNSYDQSLIIRLENIIARISKNGVDGPEKLK